MIIILGIGVATTFTIFYLGKKGWQALHTAVGISPGILSYQDPNAPLLLTNTLWQRLNLNDKHLTILADSQLRQLERIDKKVAAYHHAQQSLQEQVSTPLVDESQFMLHKLLYTRLPEVLASHYHLISNFSNTKNHMAGDTKHAEARKIFQEMLDNIEQRLDKLLADMETQHLQDLRVMKCYLDSHN